VLLTEQWDTRSTDLLRQFDDDPRCAATLTGPSSAAH
jgi:hypothetical protein